MGSLSNWLARLVVAQVLIAWGSPLDPLVIVNFRFLSSNWHFQWDKKSNCSVHIWWCTSLVMRIRVGSTRHRALETFLFKYYCFYSNLLVYLYCNNLKLIKYGMSKTIIKMVLQLLVPKQQYNTNEEAIKACKF
jgi:hypothetical protein